MHYCLKSHLFFFCSFVLGVVFVLYLMQLFFRISHLFIYRGNKYLDDMSLERCKSEAPCDLHDWHFYWIFPCICDLHPASSFFHCTFDFDPFSPTLLLNAYSYWSKNLHPLIFQKFPEKSICVETKLGVSLTHCAVQLRKHIAVFNNCHQRFHIYEMDQMIAKMILSLNNLKCIALYNDRIA